MAGSSRKKGREEERAAKEIVWKIMNYKKGKEGQGKDDPNLKNKFKNWKTKLQNRKLREQITKLCAKKIS